MGILPTGSVGAAAALIALAATPARAQIDYRNLDDDRPTRISLVAVRRSTMTLSARWVPKPQIKPSP